jgi:hypothetical protein
MQNLRRQTLGYWLVLESDILRAAFEFSLHVHMRSTLARIRRLLGAN